MKVRFIAWTLLAASLLCGSARAGQPPATRAEARNVRGLETGDAGQNFDRPTPGAGAPPQISANTTAWTGGRVIVATLVVAVLFCVLAVQAHPLSAVKRDARH